MPVGELAAVATAFLFAIGSTFFTAASRESGATAVNRSRLLFAAVVAMALLWLTTGAPVPLHAPARAWFWLVASGIIGLALGDESLFRAFVLVGPARAMLIFSMAPAIVAVLGYALLGESLSLPEIAGIVLTLSGIAWVVTAPRHDPTRVGGGPSLRGLAFAAGGALGQALGLITAKFGMLHGVAPQPANTIRLLAGATAVWLLVLARSVGRDLPSPWPSSLRATSLTAIGALTGPVFGVWLSLVAIDRAPGRYRVHADEPGSALPPTHRARGVRRADHAARGRRDPDRADRDRAALPRTRRAVRGRLDAWYPRGHE